MIESAAIWFGERELDRDDRVKPVMRRLWLGEGSRTRFSDEMSRWRRPTEGDFEENALLQENPRRGRHPTGLTK